MSKTKKAIDLKAGDIILQGNEPYAKVERNEGKHEPHFIQVKVEPLAKTLKADPDTRKGAIRFLRYLPDAEVVIE